MATKKNKYILDVAAGSSTEKIRIGDMEFRADIFTLKESNEFAEAGIQDESSMKELVEAIMPFLERRKLSDKELTLDFLMDNLTQPGIQKLMQYLTSGRNPN